MAEDWVFSAALGILALTVIVIKFVLPALAVIAGILWLCSPKRKAQKGWPVALICVGGAWIVVSIIITVCNLVMY